MGADIERCEHLPGGIFERHRQRAQPYFQFLVDDDPALPANLLDALAQRFGVCKVRLVLICRSARSRYSSNAASSSAASRMRPMEVQYAGSRLPTERSTEISRCGVAERAT